MSVTTSMYAAVSVPRKLTQGKYGLYLVDRDSFLILKEEHKRALARYKELKRYWVYYRKHVANRPQEQKPPVSSMCDSQSVIEIQVCLWRVRQKYLALLTAYRAARRPYSKEAEVPFDDYYKNLVTSGSMLSRMLPEVMVSSQFITAAYGQEQKEFNNKLYSPLS